MTASLRLGILGGTFDPIHVGHLAVAHAAATRLGLTSVLFVPSHHPPHRRADPRESAYHRFAMVALSIAGDPAFIVSDMELQHDRPSYTSRTLRALADRGFDRSQMFFITGADAFAEIATWNEYPDVLDLSQFVVVSRPGHAAAAVARQLPALESRMTLADGPAALASSHPSGGMRIYLVTAETPDVSSTIIRARLAGGQPLTGLVAPAVEDYIARHGLYVGDAWPGIRPAGH